MWSADPASLSWIEICTWSSPASANAVEGLVRDPDRGGDQIGVKAGRMGTGGDVDEIAPRAGLAARQMHLQHAKLRRFAEDAQPGRGIELVRSCIERERVRAIRAAERTAMGQLGEKPEWLMHHGGTDKAA